MFVLKTRKDRVLTDKNEKIFYDGSHYTRGARFFGKLINNLKWFDEIK